MDCVGSTEEKEEEIETDVRVWEMFGSISVSAAMMLQRRKK